MSLTITLIPSVFDIAVGFLIPYTLTYLIKRKFNINLKTREIELGIVFSLFLLGITGMISLTGISSINGFYGFCYIVLCMYTGFLLIALFLR